MRVKIGNTWYNSTEQPICIETNPVEREQIAKQVGDLYAIGPDDAFGTPQAWFDWMGSATYPDVPMRASSVQGGDMYVLLRLAHSMAGRLANEPGKQFWLKEVQSDPILTVWSNGIIDLEARSVGDVHEYRMVRL